MHFVFGVIAFNIALGSMHQVKGSISTRTGMAPVYNTALAVATKVRSGIITSSPFFIPKDANAKCKPVVPLETANAYFVPINEANLSSNRVMNSPKDDTQPDFTALTTYLSSF